MACRSDAGVLQLVYAKYDEQEHGQGKKRRVYEQQQEHVLWDDIAGTLDWHNAALLAPRR